MIGLAVAGAVLAILGALGVGVSARMLVTELRSRAQWVGR